MVVVKTLEAKRGFVLLPWNGVVERSFAWMSRFHRLARDRVRLPQALAGLHFLAFACLMLHQYTHLMLRPSYIPQSCGATILNYVAVSEANSAEGSMWDIERCGRKENGCDHSRGGL